MSISKNILIAAAVLIMTVFTPVRGAWNGCDVGFCNVAAPASAGYTGPGDVVSGAYAFWSLRCYSAAKATGTTKVANIRRASDNTTMDIVCLTNGNFDTATASTFCNATSCFVTKLYDQSGNTNCFGAACDLSQATNSQQPALTFNCLNTSLPCLTYTRASSQTLNNAHCTANGGSQSQPYTFVAAAERTGTVTSQNEMISCHATDHIVMYFNSSANQAAIFAGGGVGTATATDSTWHRIQGVFNGASSSIDVDATNTTGLNPGTGVLANLNGLALGADAQGADFLDGKIAEGGIWPIGFSGGQLTSMDTNIHNYYGI